MYDKKFFDLIAAGCRASAAEVVPVVFELVNPSTVVDVGCGSGWWALEFQNHGATVLGVDGFANELAIDNFVQANLSKPLPALGSFDLAVNLEVAEHLPASRAKGFIDDLCGLAPNVLFSAAIPGQGGLGHINERPPSYWVEMFEQNGFSVSGALRWQFWTNPQVENWYCQNLMFASRTPESFPSLFNHPLTEPIYVIHPVLWESKL